MILQDLIRNYITYREVLKPVIESWTESLVAIYPKHLLFKSSYEANLALKEAIVDSIGERLHWHIPQKNEFLSISYGNGTRTITTLITVSKRKKRKMYAVKTDLRRATSSKDTFIVLTGHQVNEFAVGIGKTHNTTPIILLERTDSCSPKTVNATTGYARKQIIFFLIPETHEKREYLGEFSLTHEAIHLGSFWEGGEYHDTDQKQIAATV